MVSTLTKLYTPTPPCLALFSNDYRTRAIPDICCCSWWVKINYLMSQRLILVADLSIERTQQCLHLYGLWVTHALNCDTDSDSNGECGVCLHWLRLTRARMSYSWVQENAAPNLSFPYKMPTSIFQPRWESVDSPPLPHPDATDTQLYPPLAGPYVWAAHKVVSRILWLLIINLICILIRMVEN